MSKSTIQELRTGDHISWKTKRFPYMIRHHAIVVAAKDGTLFKVIHVRVDSNGNSSARSKGCSRRFFDLCCTGINESFVVSEDIIDLNEKASKQKLLRYDYALEECKDPFEVIQKAKRKLGKFDFHILNNNCEHFALWCKTGNKVSYQAELARNLLSLLLLSLLLLLISIT